MLQLYGVNDFVKCTSNGVGTMQTLYISLSMMEITKELLIPHT